jgi:hypothetical protein
VIKNDNLKVEPDNSVPEDSSAQDKSDHELSAQSPDKSLTGHEKHCFVVMPSGRDSSEQKWFKGWYEVVIKPAVVEVGYVPVLAAAEEQPGAINDEIRTHLAIDSMVVVDLGGAESEDDPNPNVMYELGIRHALGLPLVMMAWKGQRLPFDVGNQRVIMEDRDLMDLELNRRKLISFIRAAEEGRYYRPMEAVSRLATIQAASQSLAEDSLLRALAQEVQDLRITLTTGFYRRQPKRVKALTIKRLIQGKVFRKELYALFFEHGGNPKTWGRVLGTPIPVDAREEFQAWSEEEWKDYVIRRAKETPIEISTESAGSKVDYSEDQLILAVREMLPPQPWPEGIHKEIADKLGVSDQTASNYIDEALRLGELGPEVDPALHSADEGSQRLIASSTSSTDRDTDKDLSKAGSQNSSDDHAI